MDNACFFDAGQSHVKALELDRQATVVDPEEVEHGGVEVAHVHTILHHIIAQFVGLPVADTSPNATAGEPHGEGFDVVIAPDLVPSACGRTHRPR